ncbi:hypothetical protein BS17DRAFT_785750 [Gyrodon lividus]|nr:hypothetical protein BS17DRAFT_785750 [Gyrodon lividus]
MSAQRPTPSRTSMAIPAVDPDMLLMRHTIKTRLPKYAPPVLGLLKVSVTPFPFPSKPPTLLLPGFPPSSKWQPFGTSPS